jgi:superfamily II DNA or RNA helicase
MMKLRPYQLQAIEKLRQSIRNGNKRVILQAPCGAGKTIIAAEIVRCALAKNKKVIFLVHFRQLAYQAVERFTAMGMGDQIGVIMAGIEPELDRPIQIISVQTYGKRLQRSELKDNKWFKEADIVIYDEAHQSIAKSRKDILNLYKKNAITIGLTATPCRADGRGLGEIYQDIIPVNSIDNLISSKNLVPIRYFGSKELPDLKNIPVVAGDYSKKVLGERVDKKKLVGNILENWLRIASDRQTVIFAVNVKHSKHIQETFEQHDIPIEHVDAHTTPEDRQATLKRFESGETQVVTNVGVYSEGADFPVVSCIVLAQPSKSYGRYIQRAGRGLRPYPGKEDCIIIDHARMIENHGYVEDKVDWTLDGKKVAWKKPKKREKDKILITCEECQNIFYGNKCPQCGLRVKGYSQKVAAIDAQLAEITTHKAKKLKAKTPATRDEKAQFYGQLKHEQMVRGYKPGWIAQQYKKKFKKWPRNMENAPEELPDQAFKNWLTYQRIKYFHALAGGRSIK